MNMWATLLGCGFGVFIKYCVYTTVLASLRSENEIMSEYNSECVVNGKYVLQHSLSGHLTS